MHRAPPTAAARRRISLSLVALAASLVLARHAQAQFITSASQLGPPARTITFSQYLGVQSVRTPINVSLDPALPVTLTASGTAGTILSDQQYNLGGLNTGAPPDAVFCINGAWRGQEGYVGLFPGSIATFMWGAAATGVGAFMNYVPLCGTADKRPPTISLLGASGAVLETYNVDALGRIVTPNGLNEGAFRGALRSQADVFGVQFTGAFLVLDNLQIAGLPTGVTPPPVTTVPEPRSGVLIAAALGGIHLARRIRRRA